MGRLMVSISGVRGEVPEVLTPRVAEDFGAAFAAMLGPGKTVVLGRDTRSSGPAVRDAVTAGLTAGGLDVVDLGVVSTPGVALMTKRLGADGGVVITASHNPLPYNGIKFLSPEGLSLPAGQGQRLKALWQAGQFSSAGAPGKVRANDQTHQVHVEAVCDILDTEAIASRRFKVVLDSINGAGIVGSKLLLERLGCELVHINDDPEADFAHRPEPLAENLTGLCEAVRRAGAAIGFAQDPDADRLAIVDETGNYIGEEYTLPLTAAFVLRHRRGDLATNLSTSRMMDAVAERFGVKLHRAPVGEANVAARMVQANCVFGGEGNGGVMDPRVVIVRDSFVGMGLMLNYLAESGKTVSALARELPRYEMIKQKFPCPVGQAERVLDAVKAAFARQSGARFNEEDGIRVDLPEGWVHVRPSNTEPIIRITAEGTPGGPARAIAAEAQRLVQEALEA
ncbi:MAG: phosphoglucosamine mutase [Planctomycetales bacterium 4484_123]|nr:MAG: phosphoglucosamine mutase [Planctomycetales bacterium 4484_123]